MTMKQDFTEFVAHAPCCLLLPLRLLPYCLINNLPPRASFTLLCAAGIRVDLTQNTASQTVQPLDTLLWKNTGWTESGPSLLLCREIQFLLLWILPTVRSDIDLNSQVNYTQNKGTVNLSHFSTQSFVIITSILQG